MEMQNVFAIILLTGVLYSVGMAQHQISPDGRSYVFYEKLDENNTEIFIREFNGRRIRITEHPFPDYNPQWSPDGKKIIFYRKDPQQYQADVFLVSADGTGETRLTQNEFYDSDPSLSPDGRLVSFGSNRDGDFEIFSMNSDGSDVKQLTSNDQNDWSPGWSPDSKMLVFVSDITGNFEIYVMNSDGSGRQRLTTTGGENYKPDWSPDGRWIAFLHRDNEKAKFDIFLASLDARETMNLTKTPEQDEYPCGWRGDEFFYNISEGIKSHNLKTNTTRIVHSEEER